MNKTAEQYKAINRVVGMHKEALFWSNRRKSADEMRDMIAAYAGDSRKSPAEMRIAMAALADALREDRAANLVVGI